jgi:CHAT domain-containing protein
VKTVIVACAALLLLAGSCNHEDTGTAGVWGRTVEPHLTTTRSWHRCTRKLSPGHVVAEAQCGEPPVGGGRCDVIGSRDEADAMLVSRRQCTDAAIAALQSFSRVDGAALSDLAAAYYVRAQRNDDPADLLRAFDAGRRAVALTPRPPGAQFNLALVLEALSLDSEAADAWRRAADDEKGAWADEARAHRAALIRATAEDGQRQWARIRPRLDEAISAGDAGRMRPLIAAFPAAAESYFEEEVLPQWAAAPSPHQVARVRAFATALSEFFNDRYFRDVAAAIADARSPAVVQRLRAGHFRFAQARAAEQAPGAERAVPLYAEAAQYLRQAGSPQCLLARIAHAGQTPLLASGNGYEASLRELEAVEAEARLRRYPSVIARVELNRINDNQFLNRYGDLFASWDAAQKAYAAIGDWEDRVAADGRAISALSVVGMRDAAWRDAFADLGFAPRVLNWKTRHLLLGVTAKAALALGYPEAAKLYETIIVNHPANATDAGIALRERAAVELRLGRYDDAQRDIDAAVAAFNKSDDSVRRALQARLTEVEAETALHVDPGRAASLLSDAIRVAAPEYTTYRAQLFAERAEALRRAGRGADAEADMAEALDQLHREEEGFLAERQHGSGDDLWNSYFSRFDKTYDLLIRQLVDEGHSDDAFRYAERVRAFEPLDLVRRLPMAPAEFRALAAEADHLDIARLRRDLPPGTFLIEYRVLDDRTYAWIVSRDVFAAERLTARRADVDRWTAALQEAARDHDSAAFDAGLFAPYESLLRKPLEDVHRIAGRAPANIVIVPDRELRGMPFDALRDPDTKRYAIENDVLSISGSALLYVFSVLRDRDLRPGDASALLIGDPAIDPQFTLARGLQRLSGARREVETIRPWYVRSDVLTGNAATAPRFLQMANGHAVIHVAAHAIINGDAPSQSFLLFTPSGAGHGVLDAATLVKQLHADTTRLVVLGACSSAGGLPVGAEGIAPLVRPIVAAGVPGVIGALWDINDATAAELLVSFHRAWRQGKNAAAALREAQLKLLQSSNPGLKSGLAWAPFEVIGYASSPFSSKADFTKEKRP